VAICDPAGKHRAFAQYLSQRGFQPFLSSSPARLWSHVEQHDLHGAILFVDRLSTSEFALLLGDLTLSPIAELPIVIASQRESRRRRAADLNLDHLTTLAIPCACSDLRTAIENVLSSAAKPGHANLATDSSRNGHAGPPVTPKHSAELPADSSLETS
jgi:hypothetical protein